MTKKKDNPLRRGRPKEGWRQAFLEALEDVPVVAFACQKAGVARSTVYKKRAEDEVFARAWDDALEIGADTAEAACWTRGVDGVDNPVFQGGECVGHIRRFSDALLLRMLERLRPERWTPAVARELAAARIKTRPGARVRLVIED